MRIIQGTTEFELEGKSAAAIGKFDGIHKGHQKLLDRIISLKEEGLQAAVFTFDPPAATFFARVPQKELTTREEKRKIFKALGVDVLVEYPLNTQTAAISPQSFIKDILVQRMHAVSIAAGNDLSYGYLGKGDCKLLKSLAKEHGYEVAVIEKVCLQDREISSTYVRQEVAAGNMAMVTRLLGYNYSITGTVLRGNRFGRTIQMPTVNLYPGNDKMLPPNGVYYSKVIIGDKLMPGMTNIGFKPTVTKQREINVETYIYDFDEDIYGSTITVELLSYKRPEIKFASVEALKDQMYIDRDEGRIFFGL